MTTHNIARLISPVLSNIPWYTTVLECSNLTELEGMVSFRNFLEHLHQYELRLFNLGGCSESLMAMQRLLGLDPTDIRPLEVVGKHVTLLDANSRDGVKLCGLICAYRLLDVIALLEGRTPRSPLVKHCLLEKDITAISGLEKLMDWPTILTTFRKTMLKGNVPPDVNRISNENQKSATLRLLSLVTYNEWSKNYKQIEGNFLAAAMHVACMQEFEFTRDSYPDITEKLEEMVNGTCDNPLPLSDQEKEDLDDLSLLSQIVAQSVKGAEGLMFLRSPLQLSLLISPIYLLCGVQLTKRHYNRRTMLLTNQLLGNEKTDLTIEVEKVIWKVVFSLAEGRLDPAQLLHRLCQDLPWEKIIAAKDSAEHCLWFDFRRCLPGYESAPTSDRINGPADAAGQSNIPECASPPTSPKAMVDVSLPQCNAEDLNQAGQAAMDISQDDRAIDPRLLSGTARLPPPSSTAYDGDCPMLTDEDVNQDTPSIGETLDEEMDDVANEKQCTAMRHIELDGVNNETKNSEATGQAAADDDESCQPDVAGGGSDDGNGSDGTSSSIEAKRRKPKALPEKRKRKAVSMLDVESDGDEDDVPLCPKPDSVKIQLSSIWEPEAITEFTELETISLLEHQNPAKVSCDTELEAFDTQGQKHIFRPQFHYGDYNDRLKQFFERIKSGYENNQPLHIANPTRSGFEIVPYAIFQSMSPEELHRLHRHKNIVVTGYPIPKLKFDEVGLRTLAPLDSQVSIVDYTYPVPLTVSGTFRNILDNANKPDGKILNGLDLPLWDDNLKERLPYATDMAAWDYVRGRPHGVSSQYPTTDMRWGLAGTANAVTFFHIDSDGYSTFLRVIYGKKVWGIYRHQPPHLSLSSTNLFLDKNFRLDEILDQSTFGLEAIVLQPGDMLLMQPGIPHFVYGPEHTICYGGHYYSTCLMQATLRSLIHSFVLGYGITNASHVASRALIRRIVHLYGLGLVEKRIKQTDAEYCHLPDMTTFDGLLDLLSACTLAILGNVLEPRTYSAPNQSADEAMSDTQKNFMMKYDRNNIPTNERKAIIYARGVALYMFRWVRSEFDITGPDGHVVEDLPSRFLVQILKALITYKAQAMRSAWKGSPHCDTASLKRQVTNVVRCDPLIEKMWNNGETLSENSLEFEGKDGYSVKRKDEAGNEAPDPSPDLYRLMGLTAFDVNFKQGEAERTKMEGLIGAGAHPFKKLRNA